MLKEGISAQVRQVVEERVSAKSVGSGTLDVLATPMMIAWMEQAAWTSVADELEPGMGTVGTLMDVKHLSATPIGMEVTVTATLRQVDGRRLVFDVHASDAAGPIGEGTHERFIVEDTKFQSKANAKIPDHHQL